MRIYLPTVYMEIQQTPYYYHTHGLSKVKSWTPERLVWMLEKDGLVKIERDHKTRRYESMIWLGKEKFDSKFIRSYLEGKTYTDYQEIDRDPMGRQKTIHIIVSFTMLAGVLYMLYKLGAF